MIEIFDLEQIQKNPKLRESMHALRYRMFCERHGWDVSNIGGFEIDQFDRLEVNPIYLVARDQNCRVSGTCRLLPTTGPYMVRDIFSDMMNPRVPPNDPRIWESNRIAVDSNATRAVQTEISAALLAAIGEFGFARGITRTIGIYSLPVIRLMSMLGAVPIWQSKSKKFPDSRCRVVIFNLTQESYQTVLRKSKLSSPVVSCDWLQKDVAA